MPGVLTTLVASWQMLCLCVQMCIQGVLVCSHVHTWGIEHLGMSILSLLPPAHGGGDMKSLRLDLT